MSCSFLYVPISRATRIRLARLLNKIVVAFVYLLAQFAEVLGALCFLADDQQVEDVIQHIRGDLLGCIAPGTVRVAVALDNQSVEAQIHSLLAEWSNQFALSTYVAGVTDNRKVGNSAAQAQWGYAIGASYGRAFLS